jgi:hypothetical protein
MEDRLRGYGDVSEVDDARCARPSGSAFPTGNWPRCGRRPTWPSAPAPQVAGHRRDVQVGGYVCGRVRSLHALLLLDLRRRRRNAAQAAGQEADHDPGRRSEPDRAGHRVRLLLLPRQFCAARDGHRVGDGEFEPRDGQHRLRHQRPVVLRAADDRGCLEHLRPRPAGRSDRPVRRPDALESGSRAGHRRCPDHRNQCGHDRSRRGSGEIRGAAASRRAEATGQRHRAEHEPGVGRGRQGRLSGAGPPQLRAGRAGDGDLLRPGPVRTLRRRSLHRRSRVSRC